MFEEMPSIIYSEEELMEIEGTDNAREDTKGSNKSKNIFENEDMIVALKEIEKKISIDDHEIIKEENENMEVTAYNNIVQQKDEDGNLVSMEAKEETGGNVAGTEGNNKVPSINNTNEDREKLGTPKKETMVTLSNKVTENANQQMTDNNKILTGENAENVLSENNDAKLNSRGNSQQNLNSGNTQQNAEDA